MKVKRVPQSIDIIPGYADICERTTLIRTPTKQPYASNLAPELDQRAVGALTEH